MLWSKWSRLKDGNGFRIRRYRKIDGKIQWDSYKASEYSSMSADEIAQLVVRLNASRISKENSAKERYQFDHAYINTKVIEKFEAELASCMEREGVVMNMNWLRVYILDYFVIQKKLADPTHWPTMSVEWGSWLEGAHKNKRGNRITLSIQTMLMVIQLVNRFLSFLSEKCFYEELGPIRAIKPFGKGKIKTKRAVARKPKDEGYISKDLFTKICRENSDSVVLPNFKLQYWYGLRIGESQGLTRDSFRAGYLMVDKQGVGVNLNKIKTSPLKTRDVRKVQHWFVDPREARAEADKVSVMHKSTLKEKMNEMLSKYGFNSHDCRRSFITDAIEKHGIYATQLAAGHRDVRTTMAYQRDKRNLEDAILD